MQQVATFSATSKADAKMVQLAEELAVSKAFTERGQLASALPEARQRNEHGDGIQSQKQFLQQQQQQQQQQWEQQQQQQRQRQQQQDQQQHKQQQEHQQQLAQAPGQQPKQPHDLALGMAIGVALDAITVFLISLLKVSDCLVVLFVDQDFNPSRLQALAAAAGLTLNRVAFERPGVTGPVHSDTLRYHHYRQFLRRASTDEKMKNCRFIQLSDVSNVAFQDDPFHWVQNQEAGLYLFEAEAEHRLAGNRVVAAAALNCFGKEILNQLLGHTLVPSGYILGTAEGITELVDLVVQTLTERSCQAQGADDGVINYIARGRSSLRVPVLLRSQRQGPVWHGLGKEVAKTLLLDKDGFAMHPAGLDKDGLSPPSDSSESSSRYVA